MTTPRSNLNSAILYFNNDVPYPPEVGTSYSTFNAYQGGVFVKQDWSLSELAQHFTVTLEELELVGNKTGATRLGFAVLLKYFQSPHLSQG